jgi:hypothetical protein
VVRAHLIAARPPGAIDDTSSPSDCELSDKALQAASALDPRMERPGYVPPEEALVRMLAAQGDEALRGLAISARRVFVDALAPRHMPVGWEIERGNRGQKQARPAAEPGCRCEGSGQGINMHQGN